jgi:hypothetical protein
MPQFPDYKPLIQNVLDLELSDDAKRKILFDNGACLLGLDALAFSNFEFKGAEAALVTSMY